MISTFTLWHQWSLCKCLQDRNLAFSLLQPDRIWPEWACLGENSGANQQEVCLNRKRCPESASLFLLTYSNGNPQQFGFFITVHLSVLATPNDENGGLLFLGRLSMKVSSGTINGKKWAPKSF
jgi:hypothetical protein